MIFRQLLVCQMFCFFFIIIFFFGCLPNSIAFQLNFTSCDWHTRWMMSRGGSGACVNCAWDAWHRAFLFGLCVYSGAVEDDDDERLTVYLSTFDKRKCLRIDLSFIRILCVAKTKLLILLTYATLFVIFFWTIKYNCALHFDGWGEPIAHCLWGGRRSGSMTLSLIKSVINNKAVNRAHAPYH